MKRFVLPLLAALALASCGKRDETVLQGYGEADYIYVAPQDGGVLGALEVKEGDRIAQGATLFRLTPDRAQFAAASARAEAAAAGARAANAGALAQAVAAAAAQAQLAERDLARSQILFRDGVVSRAKLDADRAAAAAAAARLRQARAEQSAGRGEAGAARAQSGLAAQRLADTSVNAPADGTVERLYHRAGEVVGAGDPVLSLLTPANMKIRFFAPERMLSRLRPGQRIAFSCDACPAGLTGRISFIASEPQFTPPVIYSRQARDTLVYLVEARPDQPGAIRPGQPVDVEIAPR
ncbi:MAG: HlyD family secretion protein [Hyphomonadaceae bacterium]